MTRKNNKSDYKGMQFIIFLRISQLYKIMTLCSCFDYLLWRSMGEFWNLVCLEDD